MTTLTKEQKKSVTAIRKLIGAKDFETVSSGIDRLNELADPAIWEVFGDGLEVDNRGKITAPKGTEVFKRVKSVHRTFVGLWALNKTGRLSDVTKLGFSECQWLKDLDLLEGCTKLTEFSVDRCYGLTNVDALRHCSALENVSLYGCLSLRDVSALRDCEKLSTIELGADTISNLEKSALEGIPNFTVFKATSCSELTHLDALDGCTNLREITLMHCHALTDLSGLKRCTNLQALDFWSCSGLKDLSPLASNLQLSTLEIRNCASLPDELNGTFGTRAAVEGLMNRFARPVISTQESVGVFEASVGAMFLSGQLSSASDERFEVVNLPGEFESLNEDAFYQALGLDRKNANQVISRSLDPRKFWSDVTNWHENYGRGHAEAQRCGEVFDQLRSVMAVVLGKDSFKTDPNHPVYVVGVSNEGDLVGLRSIVCWA